MEQVNKHSKPAIVDLGTVLEELGDSILGQGFIKQTAQRCVEIVMKDDDLDYSNPCQHIANAIRKEFGLEDEPIQETERSRNSSGS